jgi:hypothetical protein
MRGPSNIKIQKTGAEEIGNGHGRLPASDLEREADLVASLRFSAAPWALTFKGAFFGHTALHRGSGLSSPRQPESDVVRG